MQILSTPITYLKGVGPKRADLLKSELNIVTYLDLLTYYPFRYIDRRKLYKINEIRHGTSYIQIKGWFNHTASAIFTISKKLNGS